MQLTLIMVIQLTIGNGYDITIKKEKTGPLPQNVKYSIIPARGNSPLN